MNTHELPECAKQFVDERHVFLYLAQRVHEHWTEDVSAILHDSNGLGRAGADPSGMFSDLTPAALRRSLLPVSRRGAEDLMGLLAVGSFCYGPDPTLRQPNEQRDAAIRAILEAAGDHTEFFTNHGHAEDGDSADFLTRSFHFNSLANVLYDVCLIGVSPERLLIAWRFEDA
ncbi:hypothetical protein [Streptomyces yerevanensis]|uniref:hypothetical protein n=1 Tax=Streptomyces yerevanensis TaxID=66378 RepID=UPI0005263502|nr:hypothetical protein [Streptomyces yerevanensis]